MPPAFVLLANWFSNFWFLSQKRSTSTMRVSENDWETLHVFPGVAMCTSPWNVNKIHFPCGMVVSDPRSKGRFTTSILLPRCLKGDQIGLMMKVVEKI